MSDIKNDSRIVLTLDAGGTNLVFGAMKGGEYYGETLTLPSNAGNLDLCLQAMVLGFGTIIERLGEEKPVAISFAFPGPIQREFSLGAEELEIRYATVSTVTDPFAPAREIYYQICEHQEKHRQAELESEQCLTGAHKDDLEILINGRAARAYASQGQTRTAALSVKLAEREIFLDETGEYPILLLDDVLSELDDARQAFVLNRIGGGQTLITCCEDEGISNRTGGRVLVVEKGRIR